MKNFWTIVMENYECMNRTYYFESYKIAKENLDKIIQTYKDNTDIQEFKYDDTSCSCYDNNYNEYSTYVFLVEMPLPPVLNGVIF